MNPLRVSALAVSLIAGCAGGAGTTPEPTPVASPTASATAAPREPTTLPASPTASPAMPTASAFTGIAQAFDIGGRSLYIECRGEGSPTILFLHGYNGDRTHGYHLFDGYADRHRVCVYDRAHIGLSDPAEGVQSGADVIGDLKRLLEAADVPGPHLLVANSFGGVLAEVFAGDQPDEVAGMVLVDASLHSDADLDRYFADRGELDLEALKTEFASGPEPIHWTIHDEAHEALDRIPDVPITYLRASESSDVPPEAQQIWEAGLDALLARSSNARVVDVEGPHSLPPPPVHEAVDQMLDFLRPGLQVPPSGSRWSNSLTAHVPGETHAPLAYYEYLPPGYGDGDASPLLVFLHGLVAGNDVYSWLLGFTRS
jgi:pimeloyl-ACP methyl ester carboxylesterase